MGDHFIALSSMKNMKWSYGKLVETVKFTFNCDERYIYSPQEVKHQTCTKMGKNQLWKIVIDQGLVKFYTDGCGWLTAKADIGAATHGDFYVFIGASQDKPGAKSKFHSVSVTSRGVGVREI